MVNETTSNTGLGHWERTRFMEIFRMNVWLLFIYLFIYFLFLFLFRESKHPSVTVIVCKNCIKVWVYFNFAVAEKAKNL